eukprot:12019625-Alexandrium_andersonii.AAC.1
MLATHTCARATRKETDYPGWSDVTTKREFGRMIGNAVSLTIAEHALVAVLWSVGLVKKKPSGRWVA